MPIYDVENRFSYYNSYSDNIMSGSALPTLGSSTWDRGVIGSVVSGSEEWRASIIYSDYLFKISSSFFRSGEVRYLRLSSNNQAIEDSITPDIVEIYKTGSFGSGSFMDRGYGAPTLLFSFDGKEITGSNLQRVNNTEWVHSYPFEKKYSAVTRTIKDSYGFNREYVLDETTDNIYMAGDNVRVISNKNNIFLQSTYVGPTNKIGPIAATNSSFQKVSLNIIDKSGYVNSTTNLFVDVAYYGVFGDNIINIKRFIFGINATPVLYFSSPVQVGSNSNYNSVGVIGYNSEGWKYGIYNGLPTNFSAVFRQNHYGQFRDMLEQRIYTATYNNPQIGGPMDANGGIKFISGSSLAGESNNKLTASIYAADNVTEAYRVNPYGSGIFDTLYRASQPWHADDTRPKFEFPRRVEV